ncbi:MAG: hypoxanthine phosphoribosyltransferase [Thermodesulfobacteriota bacterium]
MTTALRPIFSPEAIAEGIVRIAVDIRKDYPARTPLLIGILNASFVFMADLVRCLNIPLEVDFMGVTSYGSGTISSGSPRITGDVETQLAGRDIIVVETMVETGLTLATVIEHLEKRAPATIKVCALLEKERKGERTIAVDYSAFTIGDDFVGGYGMDYRGEYRHLPGIYLLEAHNEARGGESE